MKKLVVALIVAGSLMAFGSAALAHEHDLTTPGTCTVIPQEPAVIHDADPTNGAVPDNDPLNPNLHPVHNFLHKGALSGSPANANPAGGVTIAADTNVNRECG